MRDIILSFPQISEPEDCEIINMFALIIFYEWNLNFFGIVLCNRGWFELQDLGPSPWSLRSGDLGPRPWSLRSGDLGPSSWSPPASLCRCHISGSHFPICNMRGLDTRTLASLKYYNSMSLLVIWFIHQNKYWWKSQEEHTLDFSGLQTWWQCSSILCADSCLCSSPVLPVLFHPY